MLFKSNIADVGLSLKRCDVIRQMAGVDAKKGIPKHRKSRCVGFLSGDYWTCRSPDFYSLIGCRNYGRHSLTSKEKFPERQSA
jgi:hypothetical protein